MDCPFCDLQKANATRVIESKQHCYVILSNPRLMEGHTLVIPKRHVEKPWELTVEERKELLDTVLEHQKRITETHAKGCDIRQHYRPFMTQSNVKVNHVHFHLQPRGMEDELYKESQVHENTLWKKL